MGADAVILHLIRHARADERGPRWPDDRERPLVPQGERQAGRLAEALARLEVRFDRLFSSPYTRAVQTALPLAARLVPGRAVETLGGLAADRYPELLADLAADLDPRDRTLGCVGHEPYLGELSAYLLTGDPGGVTIRVRKSALITLTGPLAAGAMTLEAVLTAGTVKRLLG